MSSCIRCGQPSHQYGTDGMPYCDSCVFYGMNKQCQKCGMYLPSLELQMYRGQWYCQYCVMDLKDEHRAKDKHTKTTHTQQYIGEHCERCSKKLHEFVYIYKGRKLCKTCAEDEKGKDPNAGSASPMKFSLKSNKKPVYSSLIGPIGSFLARFFDWLLVKLGLRKPKPVKQEENEPEIVAVQKQPAKEKFSKKGKSEEIVTTDKLKSKPKKTKIEFEGDHSKKTKAKKEPEEKDSEDEDKEKFDWGSKKKD